MSVDGAEDITDEKVTRTGEPGTAEAVNPGHSGLFYEFDEWGKGRLWRCPNGKVAYDNGDGTVRCDWKR